MDIIIWGEASMSCAQMLELVNTLHHAVADKVTGKDTLSFGEKQMIIMGEFIAKTSISNRVGSGHMFGFK